jgi:hypothetical protein
MISETLDDYVKQTHRNVPRIYEAYPQNKFRLQILPLQRCGHYGAHACIVSWSIGRHGRNLQTMEPRLHIVLCV